ncbi:putative minor structural protein [Bacillus phage BSP7]|nr:putative minor structural protein [Bacillus phage BSP7]
MAYPIITTLEQFSGMKSNGPATKGLWHLFDGTFDDDSGNGFHGKLKAGSLTPDGKGVIFTDGAYVDIPYEGAWVPNVEFEGDWEITDSNGYNGNNHSLRSKPMTPIAGQKQESRTKVTFDIPEGSGSGSPIPIRYIRNYLNGSSANVGSHWVEIQAINQSGKNVALNKKVNTSAGVTNSFYVTDGNTATTGYAAHVTSGEAWVEVDLGYVFETLKEIKMWHYYGDGRKYKRNRLEVSENGTDWVVLFDSSKNGEYAESSSGKSVAVPTGSASSLSFAYEVSSARDYGVLDVKLNGTSILTDSGFTGWKTFTKNLDPGSYTLEFIYSINGAGTADDDAAAYLGHLKVTAGGVTLLEEGFNNFESRSIIQNMTDWTIGGWIRPTAADLTPDYTIIATTRSGSGDNPVFHLALNKGIPHVRVYKSNIDQVTNSNVYGKPLVADQTYFIALSYSSTLKELHLTVNNETVQVPLSFNGDNGLNTTITNRPLSFGHMDGSYLYTGWMSDWFLEYKYTDAQELHELYNSVKDVVIYNIDFLTEPGSIRLAKDANDEYYNEGYYISPIVDLTNPFPELGKLIVRGEVPYGYTELSAETRTSADGINFSEWQPIDSAQKIHSPNRRYIQVRLTLISSNPNQTPVVDEITFEDTSADALVSNVKVVPRVYDNNGRLIANLNKLSSLILEDEVNGEETITFQMPMNAKAKELINEYRVDLLNVENKPYNRFYIRNISDVKENGKVKYREFLCEASWYSLSTKPMIDRMSFEDCYPDKPLRKALEKTGWTIGTIDSGFELRDYVVEDKKNPLEHIRGIQEVWGGDIVFDNVNKTVSLLNKNLDTGFSIRRRKNMRSIRREINTQGLITKLTPIGANDLSIASANDGVTYLENYSWFTERGLDYPVYETEWKDERFYNAYHLKEKGIEKLAKMSRPTVSYEIGLLDLSTQIEYSHEIPELRTEALIDDDDLGEVVKVKIVSRSLNLLNPMDTTLSLSNKIKELGDEGAAIAQEGESRLDDTDAVGKTEMQELMVFNYLMNSRADNGWTGWTRNGNISVDNNSGVSGHNAFKFIGSSNGIQELGQTIYPSTRDSYTLSAQIATEGLKKYAGAQVGIKVVVTYDDDTTEEFFLEL